MKFTTAKRIRNRKGFALILVFSLASIVILLGLSLVSLTQVETASSQYDQGIRVARANARLALQMALGDLQTLTGPDQRITATADGARTPADDDFNDAAAPGSSGVFQPHWTGVWDTNNSTDNPIWLVTRPLDATYTFTTGTQDADPYESDLGTTNEQVKLVGAGTAKPASPSTNQDNHDVYVPKEELFSDNIVGLESSEVATVGHYAYWVGDNGVKASALLQDHWPGVTHDDYEISGVSTYEHERLKQMLAHRYRLEGPSGSEVDASNLRISSLVNELVLREEEDAATGVSFLGSFTQNDVLRRFHDYTGVSNGLLVDTVRGGLREDLSYIHAVNTSDTNVNDLVNDYLMPYLNVSDISMGTPPSDLTRSYPIAPKVTGFGSGAPTPKIAPVISEFHLVLRLSAKDLAAGTPPITSPVYGQFGMSVELWNPYSSQIEGVDMRVRIDNLNTSGVTITYHQDGVDYVVPFTVGLSDLMNGVSEVTLNATGIGWDPGEIKVFSGSYDPGAGSLTLAAGATIPTAGSYDYAITALAAEPFTSSNASFFDDDLSLSGPIWSPEVTLRTSSGDELHRSILSGISFYEIKSSPASVLAPSERHLSYKWELRNPDLNWVDYDPRAGQVTEDAIMDLFVDPSTTPPSPTYFPAIMFYSEYPGSNQAFIRSPIDSSVTDLLGYNSDASIENNIPLFELPRQEFLSLGALHMAEFPSAVRGHLGIREADITPTASVNDVFDRFFLSTVPQSGSTDWTVGSPLPNSRMQPLDGTVLADLQDEDSAEHLYLRGAFNVNSTSIEAWAALLQGVRLGTWVYDDPAGSTPVAGQEELDVSSESQFFRFGQSAEETWKGSFDATDLDVSRSFMRKGMRSLSDAEVVSLATEIVEAIRTRRQLTSGAVGPFVSLQDFVDTGIVETAIEATTINDSIEAGGVSLPFASSYLTQQDVLAAIAPHLAARSDTFVIRAYGDSVSPFDATRVLARAYCEAIVQRVHAKDSSESDSDPLTATDNSPGTYGREYRIIAFRWITGDEL